MTEVLHRQGTVARAQAEKWEVVSTPEMPCPSRSLLASPLPVLEHCMNAIVPPRGLLYPQLVREVLMLLSVSVDVLAAVPQGSQHCGH